MLAALLGLLLGALLLLIVPFDVDFRLNTQERIRLRMSIAWAFGLVSKEFTGASDDAKAVKPTAKIPSPTAQPGGHGGRAAMAFLRSPGMPACLYRLVRRLCGQLRVRQLYLNLIVGLDDPADTGRLCGILMPAIGTSGQHKALDLRFQPDFTQAILRAHGRGQLRVIPLGIVGAVVGFLFSPTCWRAVIAARRSANA